MSSDLSTETAGIETAARDRRRSGRMWIAVAALAATGMTLSLMSGSGLIPAAPVRAASSSASETSSGVLRLTGRTQAVQAQAILAPQIAGENLGTLTITFLAPAGSHVKKGDLLAEFDRTAQMRDFMDQQAKVSDENDKVLEAQAKEIADKATDETDITTAEDALSKAQLEMQKVEILSRIDAEKDKENLDEAKATLAQLKDTFALKRKAATASIRILEIQRDATQAAMQHAQANAALMEIHSPIDGIVVFNTIWKQGSMGEVQDGDQVRPGVPFMQVVDPAAMEVQAKVNQEDLLALSVGQPARVHLDAYPDMVLPGRLESIDPMGQPGDFSSKLRSFTATFSIQGTDPKLMPDLSAAVEITPADQDSGARGPQ
ncbi:MAG TPA: HlyD family efflux transporter periplasmic adaptor subunit [Acidobacteriaceae bacterium]|nr:HlyD family efflux transporter periplasmic adaptor subunit [Acidobacteriaceae bacterium]